MKNASERRVIKAGPLGKLGEPDITTTSAGAKRHAARISDAGRTLPRISSRGQTLPTFGEQEE